MNDVRLLPWTGEGGKPCYLDTDGTGHVSRVADTIERVQLGMAGDLLDHVADMLADRRTPPTPAQLRFLLARMSEALSDVRRIAESRGARLPVPPCDEPDQDQKCVAIPNTRRN
ncbi:hypothetical protein QQM39_29305 [Streptomyces sp. DT2A-34]|uniref:hypothetical protein n=1 Tax=Streptomyces sp. DT2A-34 TaxID=3051182 RepID=UPI00265BEDF8|nr:hypothetical protein [Streptomyces sp. DT2A-34]MDO0914780.1 hypothetical protein [Streptomyces sp. DT2A-34]